MGESFRVLLTAGPTREPLDPVRYLGNRSSGRMGVAISAEVLRRGWKLELVSGPTEVAFPEGEYERDRVETAAEMLAAVVRRFGGCDLLIMAAAVADYRPRAVSQTKLSRASGQLTLELEPTADIAAEACRLRGPHQRVVGFSLEREGDLWRAETKMRTKGLDMIVYNPLGTMSSGDVTATLLFPNCDPQPFEPMSKEKFAGVLLDHAARLFAAA